MDEYQRIQELGDEICKLKADKRALQKALKTGLEIWDEYMSQIGTCVSQDYARLNQFPMDCAELGIKLEDA